MRRIGRLIGVMVCLSIPAWADESSWSVSLQGGFAWLNPDLYLTRSASFAESFDSAPALALRVGYRLNPVVGLELSATALTTQSQPSLLDTTLISPRLELLVGPRSEGVHPFFAIGGGAVWVDRDRTGIETIGEARELDLLGSAGIGLQADVGGPLALRLDGRAVLLEGARRPVATNLELMAGIAFKWGGRSSDIDHDRIPDAIDGAPDVSEDIDGVKDDDGIPDPDNDEDAIPDPADQCPNEPETKNELADQDGCPDQLVDQDRDGVADNLDRRPDQVADRDGDGILDTADRCVDAMEIVNGYKDADGCPDELPDALKRFVGPIEGVSFLNNRATLTPLAKGTLRGAAVVLASNPEIRLQIEGHTDGIGYAADNQTLSQQRADAVKRYLTELGVAAERLLALGFGESQPIASNQTPRGRARNRRVVFRLVTPESAADRLRE